MLVVVPTDRRARGRWGRNMVAAGRRTRRNRGLTQRRGLAIDGAPDGAWPSPRLWNRCSEGHKAGRDRGRGWKDRQRRGGEVGVVGR